MAAISAQYPANKPMKRIIVIDGCFANIIFPSNTAGLPVEAGGVLGDGFMIRPSLGIRIGEPREAFTLALSYMGQDISTWNSKMEKAFKYTNFAAIRLGYEF